MRSASARSPATSYTPRTSTPLPASASTSSFASRRPRRAVVRRAGPARPGIPTTSCSGRSSSARRSRGGPCAHPAIRESPPSPPRVATFAAASRHLRANVPRHCAYRQANPACSPIRRPGWRPAADRTASAGRRGRELRRHLLGRRPRRPQARRHADAVQGRPRHGQTRHPATRLDRAYPVEVPDRYCGRPPPHRCTRTATGEAVIPVSTARSAREWATSSRRRPAASPPRRTARGMCAAGPRRRSPQLRGAATCATSAWPP